MITAETVLNVAKSELGYYEKLDASHLDSKTDNAGTKNYTKYSRDLYAAGFYNGNKQGHAWCDQFVDWCFFTACGDKEKAEALLCQTGNLGAGVGYSAQYYRNANRFFESDPQPGDQIFFYKNGVWTHTGLVLEVKNGKVYTIEGNKNNHVAKCVYPLNYATIKGYGRPRYGEQVAETYTLTAFIREVQAACGAKVDGIAGPETIGKTVTLSAVKNRRHGAVKPVQKRLAALGYAQVGEADGIAGPKFTAAVKEFQRVNRCWVDGEVTAANKTWRVLLGME